MSRQHLPKNKKILIVSAGMNNTFTSLYNLWGMCTTNVNQFMQTPEKFCLIVFTGGSDITSSYYGDISPKFCNNSEHRDKKEKALFEHAVNHEIAITGICRGAQLITALAGGRIMHDIDGHGHGGHLMYTYKDDAPIRVNSMHHQMCLPGPGTYVIGWSDKSIVKNGYIGNYEKLVEWDGPNTEAILVPKIKAAAVQYHPEWLNVSNIGYVWYYKLIRNLLSLPMDEMIEKYTHKRGKGAWFMEKDKIEGTVLASQ